MTFLLFPAPLSRIDAITNTMPIIFIYEQSILWEQNQMDIDARKPELWHANNKGADQPARPRSLISAFVIRCL